MIGLSVVDIAVGTPSRTGIAEHGIDTAVVTLLSEGSG